MSDPITLDSVFQDTAAAVRQAQSSLDLWSYTAPAVYAIPRVSVQAEFDFQSIEEHKILIFFGKKSSTEQRQFIQFSLNHTPEPAPLLIDPGPPATPVFLPPFVVSLQKRLALVQTLTNSLNNPSLVTFDFTDGAKSKLKKEVKRIHNLLASTKPESGLVFLCLDRGAGRYLIVSIGNSKGGIFTGDGPEGIFILEGKNVTVYSCLDHFQDAVYFAPFHAMTECLRQWMAAGTPRIASTDTKPPAQLGAIDVQSFAAGLWEAYSSTRQASDPRRSGYDLSGVAAQMTYQSATGNDDPADGYVESEVDLTIPDDPGPPTVKIELLSPEYVVTGETRDRFMAALQQQMGPLKDALHKAQTAQRPRALYDTYYEAALNDSQRAQTAVVLLSYAKDTPANEFLVCWKGEIASEEREFAFTCELDKGLMSKFAVVLPLEDPVDTQEILVGAQIPFRLALIRDDAYTSALHALHAQRVWDVDGNWILEQNGGGGQ